MAENVLLLFNASRIGVSKQLLSMDADQIRITMVLALALVCRQKNARASTMVIRIWSASIDKSCLDTPIREALKRSNTFSAIFELSSLHAQTSPVGSFDRAQGRRWHTEFNRSTFQQRSTFSNRLILLRFFSTRL